MYKNVIVPVNLAAKTGAMALEEAVDICRSMGAKLHIITVVVEARGSKDEAASDMAEHREEYIEEAVEIANRKLSEDEYNIVERFGSADDEIVEFAGELEKPLIVMSTRGKSGLYLLTMGSTTWKTIRKASCPVLTLTPDVKEDKY